MTVIVVTGGIGSGKSEVCKILADSGLDFQYNADMRVKRLYYEHPTLLTDIEAKLKCSLRDESGHFVPSILARIIFNDKHAMDIVESLVFPVLIEDFQTFCNNAEDRSFVVFESATILEKEQFKGFGDITILVDAPFDVRMDRACLRDNADKETVMARMRSQTLMNALSQGLTDDRIDAVIVNDGTLEDLERRTKKVISSFRKDIDIL